MTKLLVRPAAARFPGRRVNSRKPGACLAAVPASRSAMPTRAIPDRAAGETARRTTRAAYTALGWVVLFFAFHVYWYLGGSFASPGKLPGAPRSLAAWAVEVFVVVAFPLGALVCLAVARGGLAGGWRWLPRPSSGSAACCCSCAAAAGIIDDLTRATGLLPNGLTGLSTKDTTGAANLHWSGRAIEAYFLAGGIIFGLLAVHYCAQQARSRRHASRLP
jgi:hypothetical protein